MRGRCKIDETVATGEPPRITSPSGSVTYNVRINELQDERIALQATTDSDATAIYWFVDDRFVARARRDEAVLWEPMGEHRIRAIDDLGRSHLRTLVVQAVL